MLLENDRLILNGQFKVYNICTRKKYSPQFNPDE